MTEARPGTGPQAFYTILGQGRLRHAKDGRTGSDPGRSIVVTQEARTMKDRLTAAGVVDRAWLAITYCSLKIRSNPGGEQTR